MIENLAELRHQLIEKNPSLRKPSITEFDLPAADPHRMSRWSLEQQKKRAKELLKLLRAGESHGQARACAAGMQDINENLSLVRCQHIIAKELGFHNWTDLKNHIEYARVAQLAIENGKPTAPDADKHTLHIRCGTDIKHSLTIAGFCGDFLAFADPYCQGPVRETKSLEDFIDMRAEFIAHAYGLPDSNQLRQNLYREYRCLEEARDYQRVNIWLEHDSYDQLILAKLLDYFCEPAHRPEQIKLITTDRFPGVKAFHGIGQLPPDALRLLWQDFEAINEAQFATGRQTWIALKSKTPEKLLAIAHSGTPALPTMSKAVARHLQELPSLHNGLSLVEELTLRILADKGGMNAAKLFGWYTNHYEPLTFLGDTQYWDNIERLAAAKKAPMTITKSGNHPRDWRVELTDTGQALLCGAADWLTITQSKRWVGGIAIDPKKPPHWRIDRGDDQLSVKRA